MQMSNIPYKEQSKEFGFSGTLQGDSVKKKKKIDEDTLKGNLRVVPIQFAVCFELPEQIFPFGKETWQNHPGDATQLLLLQMKH